MNRAAIGSTNISSSRSVLESDLTRDEFFEALRTFAGDAEKAVWAVIY
jgi:hypothetical protein